jgi:hypothetical protein
MDEPTLSHHHRATVEQIFSHPSSANIRWRSVRSLLESIGDTREGKNGKLTVTLGDETEGIERPPGKDIDQQLIVDLRRMLRAAGYAPEDRHASVTATGDGA